MIARLPAMIAIIRNSIKTGSQSCTVPVNTLCIRILELLREHGLIQGFSFIYKPKNERKRPFTKSPSVMITFKYIDNQSPVLKDIKSFKNTVSNFMRFRYLKGNNPFIHEHVMYIISNQSGLKLTSPTSLKETTNSFSSGRTSGNIIAEIIL